MRDENCIFCKIVDGKLPSKTLYEDDTFRVILDISPATKGHTIILLKSHVSNIFELSQEDASKVFVIAKKVADALKQAFHCDGVNILQNNEEAAGQTVFHFHMHVIPRYKGDKVEIKMMHNEEDMGELSDILSKIKMSYNVEN